MSEYMLLYSECNNTIVSVYFKQNIKYANKIDKTLHWFCIHLVIELTAFRVLLNLFACKVIIE